MKIIFRSSILFVILGSSINISASAQGATKSRIAEYKPLKIGDKLPDITFKGIINYPKKNPKVFDFKGKLILLDFWSTYCDVCIAAFPEMEKLQRQFEGKIQVIVINTGENNIKIQERFRQINKNLSPDHIISLSRLPGVNGDTVWKRLFPQTTVPHHVWIDSAGKVIAITGDYNATPKHIQDILDGKKINMTLKNEWEAPNLSVEGYLKPSRSYIHTLYYSAFIPYESDATGSNGSNWVQSDSVKGIYRSVGYDGVIGWFISAFSQKDRRQRVMLELRNIKEVQYPWDDNNIIDEWKRKYSFTYEIQWPYKDKDNWQKILQQDANRFFGAVLSIEALMKKEKFKAYVLIKTNEKLLKTSGEKANKFGPDSEFYKKEDGVSILNSPFSSVVEALYSIENMTTRHPFINESGVDNNLLVDFKLTGDISDINNVRPQLKQYGLDIIEAEREVEVLVIRDKK